MDKDDQQPARSVQPTLLNETDRISDMGWRVLRSVRQSLVEIPSSQNRRQCLLLCARYKAFSIPYLARRIQRHRIMRVTQIALAPNSLLSCMFATLGEAIINRKLA